MKGSAVYEAETRPSELLAEVEGRAVRRHAARAGQRASGVAAPATAKRAQAQAQRQRRSSASA